MTKPMPKADIAALRALDQAATPGEWSILTDEQPPSIAYTISKAYGTTYAVNALAKIVNRADAALIAAMRNAFPGLLDEVERLTAEVEQYRKDEAGGMLVRLPMKPGTIIQQDLNHEFDITFTGQVLYEIVSNEDHEWESAEELTETIRVASETLACEEAEAALKAQEAAP